MKHIQQNELADGRVVFRCTQCQAERLCGAEDAAEDLAFFEYEHRECVAVRR